jgi:hypothetical protein
MGHQRTFSVILAEGPLLGVKRTLICSNTGDLNYRFRPGAAAEGDQNSKLLGAIFTSSVFAMFHTELCNEYSPDVAK